MKYFLPLLTSICVFMFNDILCAAPTDSASNQHVTFQSEIYIPLNFVMVGTPEEEETLHKALNKTVSYLNRSFKSHSIQFLIKSNINYNICTAQLLQEWKNESLPIFENELTFYVYKGSYKDIQHKYLFKIKDSEIALVPFYNQKEFNFFTLQNVVNQLGLSPTSLVLNLKGITNTASNHPFNENGKAKFLVRTTHPKIEIINSEVKLNAEVKSRFYENPLQIQQGKIIRANLLYLKALEAKRLVHLSVKSSMARNENTLWLTITEKM